jgi:hypothetical protein
MLGPLAFTAVNNGLWSYKKIDTLLLMIIKGCRTAVYKRFGSKRYDNVN